MNKQDCLQLLKTRLRSSGKQKSVDDKGNIIYIDCDIYGDDVLNSFLDLALSEFNQTPYFSFFKYDDEKFVNTFAEILVEGATLYALASQALLERGREFNYTGVVDFQPPRLSELLETQYQAMMVFHFEKLKLIKTAITTFSQ